MKIKTSWYVPERIILNEVPEVFAEGDLKPHNDAMLKLLNGAACKEHFIHAIWDFTQSCKIPSAFRQVQSFLPFPGIRAWAGQYL